MYLKFIEYFIVLRTVRIIRTFRAVRSARVVRTVKDLSTLILLCQEQIPDEKDL